ncbi:unnamed protein product [Phytomonas sp. EM1]|nr:unnamed protein product [Phytomonas sp. EM1]|eukprot:CCW65136.1 unnamed protein product [Phytomonas sp. isolate EM1]
MAKDDAKRKANKTTCFFPEFPPSSTPPQSACHHRSVSSSLEQLHGNGVGSLTASRETSSRYVYTNNRMHPIILNRYARYLRRRQQAKGMLPRKSKANANGSPKSEDDEEELSDSKSVFPTGGERKKHDILQDWQPCLHDSFGNLAYHRLFHTDPFAVPRVGDSPAGEDLHETLSADCGNFEPHRELQDTPIKMEKPPGAHSKTAFTKKLSFLHNRDFWVLLRYSIRLALIGVLFPALLVYFKLGNGEFFTLTYVLSGVLISASMSVGQMNAFIMQYIKATMMWLPLALICAAAKLGHHTIAWFVVYVVLMFLSAFLNVNITRRMSLFLLNVALVAILAGNESILQPFIILGNWSTGVAFSMLTILLPYPVLAASDATRTLERILEDTSTCFDGMLSCFWAENNTERSMFMVHIRYLVRAIDFFIEEFETHNANSFYEILFFDTYERYEVREEKAKLLWKLKMNLRTMERVINALQERPQILTSCQRSWIFKKQLSKPIQEVTKATGELLLNISRAKTYTALRNAHEFFESAGKSIKRLQEEFEAAQKTALYENEEEIFSDTHRMEEFLPLFSFFIFSIVNFWNVLDNFKGNVNRHEDAHNWRVTLGLVFTSIKNTLGGNVTLLRNLIIYRAETECRIFIEAFKVSLAMLLAVIFFYNVNSKMLLLSGPTIIAFVSGMNPVEAVHASGARLTGTLIGSVIGFFGVTLLKKRISRIIAICVVVFVMSFGRLNHDVAPICGSCTFVAVTLLSSTFEGADYTISRIQQNTFSIFIYCFISVSILPLSPGEVLYEKRLEALKLGSQSFKKIMGLLYEAASYHKDITEKRLKMKERHGTNGENSTHSNFTVTNAANETSDDLVEEKPPQSLSWFASIFAFRRPTQNEESPPAPRRETNDEKSNTFIVPVDFNVTGGKEEENAKNSDLHRSLMPRAFFKDQEDTKVADILDTIFEMLHLVISTKSIMEYAAIEFSIFPHIYPVRATGDVHIALYRLCVLLYTMACSWERMRAKGYFTEDMIHVFHNLMPLGNDLTECFERFVYVCDLYVRNPSPELCSEMMKGVTQFRKMCSEMSDRTEYDLLEVIRKVISEMILQKYVNDEAMEDLDEKGGDGSGRSGGDLNGFAPEMGDDNHPMMAELSPHSDRNSVLNVHNRTMIFKPQSADRNVQKRIPYGEEPNNARREKSHMASDPPAVQSPSTFFSTRSTCGSSSSNFIHLDNSFVMPTTALDFEGLHTFTLTLIMFGRELRKVLFGLEEMLQSV